MSSSALWRVISGARTSFTYYFSASSKISHKGQVKIILRKYFSSQLSRYCLWFYSFFFGSIKCKKNSFNKRNIFFENFCFWSSSRKSINVWKATFIFFLHFLKHFVIKEIYRINLDFFHISWFPVPPLIEMRLNWVKMAPAPVEGRGGWGEWEHPWCGRHTNAPWETLISQHELSWGKSLLCSRKQESGQ